MKLLFTLDTSATGDYTSLPIGSTLTITIAEVLAPANTKTLSGWDFKILKCEEDSYYSDDAATTCLCDDDDSGCTAPMTGLSTSPERIVE